VSVNIDEGGPAFPFREQDGEGGYERFPGMSLRDYFAAAALQGLMASPREWVDEITGERIAAWAYEQADAMIAARERKEG